MATAARLPLWLRLVPLVFLGLGVAFLAIGLMTPAYSDAAAFEAELARINANFTGEDGSFETDAMSVAFHAARERFETLRWPLIDLGYSATAWSLLSGAALWLAASRGQQVLTRTTRNPLLIGVLLLALVLMGAGLIATGAHPLARNQVPWWAYSFGIHLFEAIGLTLLLTPLLLGWTLVGLIRRSEPAPLVAMPPPYWQAVVVTIFFLPPFLWSLVLIASFGSEGGWALSPAGAILTWLLLNSRALLIAPRRAR